MVVAGTPRWRSTLAALLVGARIASVRRSLRLRPSQSPEITSAPAACTASASRASSSVFPDPALPSTAIVEGRRLPGGSTLSRSISTPAARSVSATRSWAAA